MGRPALDVGWLGLQLREAGRGHGLGSFNASLCEVVMLPSCMRTRSDGLAGAKEVECPSWKGFNTRIHLVDMFARNSMLRRVQRILQQRRANSGHAPSQPLNPSATSPNVASSNAGAAARKQSRFARAVAEMKKRPSVCAAQACSDPDLTSCSTASSGTHLTSFLILHELTAVLPLCELLSWCFQGEKLMFRSGSPRILQVVMRAVDG